MITKRCWQKHCPSCNTDLEIGLIENESTVPMDSIIDERETSFAGNAFEELKIEMGKHVIKIGLIYVNGLLSKFLQIYRAPPG